MKQKYSISQNPSVLRDIPLAQIEQDGDQPRKEFGAKGEEKRLRISMEAIGIQQPLVVSEQEPNRYVLLDGHRRYRCLMAMGMEMVLCRVYQKLKPADFEIYRYEIQNNRKPWSGLEKANALTKIKRVTGADTNAELAKYLHLSPSTIGYSLDMRDQKMEYVELMIRYDLKESYQTEFLKLKPKIRKIRNFEVPEIAEIIFKKIKCDIIPNAQELRVLKRIFLRAGANEEQLHKFLSNSDMTIKQLQRCTELSPIALLLEQTKEELEKDKRGDSYYLTEGDQVVIGKFQELLTSIKF